LGIPKYSQIGKFLTLYCHNANEALYLSKKIYEATKSFKGPMVPFDIPFQLPGVVFIRYGSFFPIKDVEGKSVLAMKDIEGNLVSDVREPGKAIPQWISNPFPISDCWYNIRMANLSSHGFIPFQTLSFRGRGRVFRALDIRQQASKICIIKEGLKNGEILFDGYDGYDRINNEQKILKDLHNSVDVPEVYNTFMIEDDIYLVIEDINGHSLSEIIKQNGSKLFSISQVLLWIKQLTDILLGIHRLGFVWRDCKPQNLILCDERYLRPIDFEGSCKISDSYRPPIVTPIFAPKELLIINSGVFEDLYALGVTMCILLTNKIPRNKDPIKLITKARNDVPNDLLDLLSLLLSKNPDLMPTLNMISEKIRNINNKGCCT
jgi:hypothetical protein